MRDKIFVDTNVLIYAYSYKDLNKQEVAFKLIYGKREDVVLSTQVINEFSSVFIKKYKVNPKVLYPKIKNFFVLFDVALITYSTIDIAFNLLNKYNFSYYDSLIVASALENECKVLYSEDM
ncbi:Predicted nucleic acid-binding protein, contains PIN domain [Persephonella hydrogeniphila]|uniref:Predicted nucleic acid-binding protein, contains PIN domain n=1 Tax=Persephonella hydrogeniphila TaxID=198703 RepID=A0A285NBY9_9AQUI|nr:PIN domain-containing protein [Persephonella hydrogeniphila]SNZ06975.1 Predicted nucleic acid-binding protein, contains PIN domain [Persephonella hydrogeniphila]